MTDPIPFSSMTPRFGLPLLFTAQAQKEFFVNEAHALTDALCHPVVQGIALSEPAGPASGQCWIVGTGATGTFEAHDNELASHQAGQWLFISPVEGMTIFDWSLGQRRYYRGGWQIAGQVLEPTGGSLIDQEARTVIAQLIDAMRAAGILANS